MCSMLWRSWEFVIETRMSIADLTSRVFEPGTTGWSVADLGNPQIQRQWERGAYEIVEGVLTKMPAAYFEGGASLDALADVIKQHLKAHNQRGRFAFEVDVVVSPQRVARVDAVFLTPEDQRRQKEANAEAGIKDLAFGRILIAPTLIIQSVSIGHEAHDRQTKRRWYAEKQVPNYWILDAYQRTLECLVLSESEYRTDQIGGSNDELRPALFPGLVIPLREIWVE